MDTKHQETVKREFAKQAQDFERGGLTLHKAMATLGVKH